MNKPKSNKIPKNIKKRVITSSLWGAIFGTALLFIMMMLFSAICLLAKDPHPLVLPLCFMSVFSSAFLAGIFALKRNGGSDALLCGLLCGALLIIMLSLLFFITNLLMGASLSEAPSIIWKLLMIPSTILGAFCGLPRKSKTQRKKGRKF